MNKNGDVCRNTIKRKSAKPMGKSCKTRKGKNRSGAVFHTTLVRLLPQSRRHGCISRDRPPSPKPQKSIKLPLLASAVTFKSLPYTQGPLSELTQEGSHSLTLSVFDRANSLFFQGENPTKLNSEAWTCRSQNKYKQHQRMKFARFWEETVMKNVNQKEGNMEATDVGIQYFFAKEIIKNICIIYILARQKMNGIF